MRYRIHAAAKINRFLLIGPPDESGFHPLVTLFQCINWYDILSITCQTPGGPFTWHGHGDTPDLADLKTTTVGRAVDALARVRHLQGSWYIHLTKRIPSGSGLGGGSSDAAAVLVGLAGVMNLGLSFGVMTELARSIGMDVPYFLTGGTVLAGGYGDRLVPLPDDAAFGSALVVVVPTTRQATAEMYHELDRRGLHERNLPSLQELVQQPDRIKKLLEQAPNSFAPLLNERHPDLYELQEKLRRWGARAVQWTGSGTGFWSLWPDLSVAWQVAQWLRQELPATFQVRPARVLPRVEYLRLRAARSVAAAIPAVK